MIQFNEKELSRLVSACSLAKDGTGSEHIWDDYEKLLQKIKNYQEEYDCPDCVYCELHQ